MCCSYTINRLPLVLLMCNARWALALYRVQCESLYSFWFDGFTTRAQAGASHQSHGNHTLGHTTRQRCRRPDAGLFPTYVRIGHADSNYFTFEDWVAYV